MHHLSTQRAAELLANMRGRSVIVFGDVMLDEFVWGDVTRISPEAPVPVVDVRRESVRLGGAANVVANLRALGVEATLVGIIGRDRAGERVRAELQEMGADDEQLIVDATRPTTTKTRIIAHSQLVVRADRERRAPVCAEIEEQLIERLQRALRRADAFIVSDYEKGAVTPRTLNQVLPFARSAHVPTLIDPKFRNFDAYRPATLVTPNHHEALRLTNGDDDSEAGIAHAARLIRARLGCHAVLVTLGERGMILLEEEANPLRVPTVAREVYDVTGAGDTVIAALGAGLAAGASLLEAAMIANHAAGVVVGKVGTATASPEEIIRSIETPR
ncbi:MAG: D-glycero-beta-D-manno-heptose-7-phosphate kinase [Pyrinomonas sp.]|uniref:D-glycero-beta-D-manno-heptose-7-phosphate kinase n=1 Tax=Pyrinomonas sp. TaxID=2080306 RepID=UPI00331EE7F9